MGLGTRPISRHRQPLFQAAASHLRAMPLGTGPAGADCGRCAGDGHVVGGMARADAAAVLAKGNVHDSVTGVFDAPTLSHRLQQLGLGAGWKCRNGRRSHSTRTGLAKSHPSRSGSSGSGGSRCGRDPSRPFPHSRGSTRRSPRPVPGHQGSQCIPPGATCALGLTGCSSPRSRPRSWETRTLWSSVGSKTACTRSRKPSSNRDASSRAKTRPGVSEGIPFGRQRPEKGSTNTREIQSQGLPAPSSVQYAEKTLLIPAAMASQSSGAHH